MKTLFTCSFFPYVHLKASPSFHYIKGMYLKRQFSSFICFRRMGVDRSRTACSALDLSSLCWRDIETKTIDIKHRNRNFLRGYGPERLCGYRRGTDRHSTEWSELCPKHVDFHAVITGEKWTYSIGAYESLAPRQATSQGMLSQCFP